MLTPASKLARMEAERRARGALRRGTAEWRAMVSSAFVMSARQRFGIDDLEACILECLKSPRRFRDVCEYVRDTYPRSLSGRTIHRHLRRLRSEGQIICTVGSEIVCTIESGGSSRSRLWSIPKAAAAAAQMAEELDELCFSDAMRANMTKKLSAYAAELRERERARSLAMGLRA